MSNLNILITGVGGQGIGVLSEVLLRAFFHSEIKVKGVDTHGLAQRGGVVTSCIKTGSVNSPLIRNNDSDIVIAMEKNEVLRASQLFLKPKGHLIYINKEIQPVGVRVSGYNIDVDSEIENICNIKECEKSIIEIDKETDINMYNIYIIKYLIKNNVIKDIKTTFYHKSLIELLGEELYTKNMKIINS